MNNEENAVNNEIIGILPNKTASWITTNENVNKEMVYFKIMKGMQKWYGVTTITCSVYAVPAMILKIKRLN